MRRSLIVALVVALAIPVSTTTPAYAANPTLNFYISPPTVQNTYVSGARIATFNDKSANTACPTEWIADDETPIGTVTATKSDGTEGPPANTECKIRPPDKFGGAVPNANDQPFPPDNTTTLPAAGTNYVGILSNKTVTLSLTQPESYLGFWWSAGDQNNKVSLFSGGPDGTRVGVFTTATLKQMLTGNVTAIDGNTYRGCQYFGNPRKVDRRTNCAGENSSPANDPNQPFAYIHLVGEGGLQFDTIVFTQGGSGGFEFDNMAIARNVVSPTVVTEFPAEINAGSPDQVAGTCEAFSTTFALTASNFTTSPTYSLSPTTLPEGLTFTPSTGGVSGTPTAGFTKTTYTLTATAGSQTATETVSLEVNDLGNTPCPPPPPPPAPPAPPNPPTPVVWEPETTTFEVTEFPAIITPDPPPPPPGGGSYTFTGDPGSTSNCTVNTTTSAMTIPQPGTCVVTATVGDTKKLSKASITVTFTITGPQLAATGAAAWPVWAGVVSILGGALIAWTTVARRHSA